MQFKCVQKELFFEPFFSRLNNEKCSNNFNNLLMIRLHIPNGTKNITNEKGKEVNVSWNTFQAFKFLLRSKYSQYLKLIL